MRHDPEFAERVRSETVHHHAGRDAKLAVVGFVVGLAVLLAFYSESVAAGLAGVAVMFVALVVLERNLRRLGKIGWREMPRPLGRRASATEHDGRDWLRTRLFRRDR